MAPKAVQPVVRHLENAAEIGRLALVEKQVGCGRIAVDAVGPLEKAERDQRVEEIPSRARIKAEAFTERLAFSGCLANSVNSSISTALSSVFEAQKPRPTCMI